MVAEVNIPPTTNERFEKFKAEHTDALRHPDSPEWFNKEYNEKLKKELIWAAPYDARFPQVCLYSASFNPYKRICRIMNNFCCSGNLTTRD